MVLDFDRVVAGSVLGRDESRGGQVPSGFQMLTFMRLSTASCKVPHSIF